MNFGEKRKVERDEGEVATYAAVLSLIQNYKRSVRSLEALLEDLPFITTNGRIEIRALADGAEEQNNSVIENIETIRERSYQYDYPMTSTNDHIAAHYLCSSPFQSTVHLESNLVGFEDDLFKIKKQLIEFVPKLSVISVVGMGGIGKTTLVKAVYNDPWIEHHFYVRAWIAVSQGYNVRKMLFDIMKYVSPSIDEMNKYNNEQLGEQLHKRLGGKRYLIVLDDIWDIEAWDNIRRYLPEGNNGSRVIFTTRLTNIARHVNYRCPTHDMHLLNMEQSLKLLSLKVFGTDSFPLELENVGRQILGKCQGLPLAIIVVAGILVKINKTPESWQNVAKSLCSSQNSGNSEECLDILALSYKYLPQHLKPCFLYIGAFSKGDEISVMKICRLLVSEGFLWEIEGKTMEEAAEYYLEDLISRSLLMATKRGYNGRVIKCNMHDLLRDLSIRESHREQFLRFSVTQEGGAPRIFSHSDVDVIHRCHLRKLHIRSFLAFGKVQTRDFSARLRVLDISFQPFKHFPPAILHLKLLRYLALVSFDDLPPSLSKLCHLETLIRHFHEASIILPETVWKMKQLRHLYFKKSCQLRYPETRMTCLPNLQTLSNLSFGSCTKETFTGAPNLKKLGLREHEAERLGDDVLVCRLNNLRFLDHLDTLKCFFTKQRPLPMPDAFPPNLKQLTLRGCRQPWKEMSVLSALPNIEVLKLKDHAFSG